VVFTVIFMRVYFFRKCRGQEKEQEQERCLGEEYGECFDKMIYEDEMKDLIGMQSEEDGAWKERSQARKGFGMREHVLSGVEMRVGVGRIGCFCGWSQGVGWW
jgi:hypothetical protein